MNNLCISLFWCLFLVNVFFALIQIGRKKIAFGVVTIIFGLWFVAKSFMFALNRDSLVATNPQTELDYFIQELRVMNLDAILVLCATIAMVMLAIFNINNLFLKPRKTKNLS
jgi:hypothetical protein